MCIALKYNWNMKLDNDRAMPYVEPSRAEVHVFSTQYLIQLSKIKRSEYNILSLVHHMTCPIPLIQLFRHHIFKFDSFCNCWKRINEAKRIQRTYLNRLASSMNGRFSSSVSSFHSAPAILTEKQRNSFRNMYVASIERGKGWERSKHK